MFYAFMVVFGLILTMLIINNYVRINNLNNTVKDLESRIDLLENRFKAYDRLASKHEN